LIDIDATLIAQIINFVILVGVLTKVAYKPLLKVLEERRLKIQGDLENAEQDKSEAAKLKQEILEKLNETRANTQSMVDKAAKLAEQTKEEILKEAREESAKLLKSAREEIEREKDKAVNELRAEVVSLSVAAAAKIIGKNIDEQVHVKLVEDFINNLDHEKTGGLPC